MARKRRLDPQLAQQAVTAFSSGSTTVCAIVASLAGDGVNEGAVLKVLQSNACLSFRSFGDLSTAQTEEIRRFVAERNWTLEKAARLYGVDPSDDELLSWVFDTGLLETTDTSAPDVAALVEIASRSYQDLDRDSRGRLDAFLVPDSVRSGMGTLCVFDGRGMETALWARDMADDVFERVAAVFFPSLRRYPEAMDVVRRAVQGCGDVLLTGGNQLESGIRAAVSACKDTDAQEDAIRRLISWMVGVAPLECQLFSDSSRNKDNTLMVRDSNGEMRFLWLVKLTSEQVQRLGDSFFPRLRQSEARARAVTVAFEAMKRRQAKGSTASKTLSARIRYVRETLGQGINRQSLERFFCWVTHGEDPGF